MEPSTTTTSEDQHKRVENKRTKESAGAQIKEDENQKIGGDLKLQKNAQFLAERKKIFDELYEEQVKKYLGKL